MKRKVLVVDDDAAIVEVLEMRLMTMGFDVTATADPQAAMTAVEAGRFDVALLDLRMEPTDGIALMEAVHAHGGRVTAESQEGKGSRFTVLLPRDRAA